MKKILGIALCVIILAACNNAGSGSNSSDSTNMNKDTTKKMDTSMRSATDTTKK